MYKFLPLQELTRVSEYVNTLQSLQLAQEIKQKFHHKLTFTDTA